VVPTKGTRGEKKGEARQRGTKNSSPRYYGAFLQVKGKRPFATPTQKRAIKIWGDGENCSPAVKKPRKIC